MKVVTSPSVLLLLAAGFIDSIVWSLVGDEFPGFAIVAARVYVSPRVACLNIMLWSVGTWFLECRIMCFCSFFIHLHSVAAGMLCLIIAAF
jgi:hypothetical protein